MIKSLTRSFLKSWAKTGITPGYLHAVVDKKSKHLSQGRLQRRIRNNAFVNCNLNDHVQSRIYFFGAYEPIEAFLCSQLLAEDSVFIDAGANIGFYSLFLSSNIPGLKSYSFEPVPDNYKQLTYNINQSSLSDRVIAIQKGLWHKQETKRLQLDTHFEDNYGSFTVGKVSQPKNSLSFDCELNRLDYFIDELKIDKVDLIKMDIEGAEYFALRGAEKTLEKQAPHLLIEFNRKACESCDYTLEELFEYIMSFGYKAYRIAATPELSGFINNVEDIEQDNLLFIKPGSLFKPSWNYKFVKKYFANS